jgi:tRNA pseudouridine38-40 synthase
MSTYKLTIAYDGTGTVGWQRQASGVSVQGLLEEALGQLDGRAVAVIGAGRTDAGAHACGQVASVRLERALPAVSLRRAVNARLPPTVRVLDAAEAPDSFHARFDARAKTYRYRIWNAEVISPFDRLYAWHVAPALDVAAMRTAASMLTGPHDFAAFAAAGGGTATTRRTIFRSRIAGDAGGLVLYEVQGDGFLRHMVRNVLGTLAEVGLGRRGPGWVAEVLTSRERARAGPTAPAEGLFLMSVAYDMVQ